MDNENKNALSDESLNQVVGGLRIGRFFEDVPNASAARRPLNDPPKAAKPGLTAGYQEEDTVLPDVIITNDD